MDTLFYGKMWGNCPLHLDKWVCWFAFTSSLRDHNLELKCLIYLHLGLKPVLSPPLTGLNMPASPSPSIHTLHLWDHSGNLSNYCMSLWATRPTNWSMDSSFIHKHLLNTYYDKHCARCWDTVRKQYVSIFKDVRPHYTTKPRQWS